MKTFIFLVTMMVAATKADFLELDVQQTKDGVLVIMHDSTVNRTTNGDGDVKDLTFKQFRSRNRSMFL